MVQAQHQEKQSLVPVTLALSPLLDYPGILMASFHAPGPFSRVQGMKDETLTFIAVL